MSVQDQTWSSVASEMEILLSGVNYETWIKPLSIVDISDIDEKRSVVRMGCPSGFHKQIVEQRYYGQIQASIEKYLEKKVEIQLDVVKGTSERVVETPLFSQASEASKKTSSSNAPTLNPRLTFDTYVVGSSNNFAHAAAQGVIKSPGKKYNPLFIYGGVGLGKTHLMHAIGHELAKNNPEAKILYVSAETFANDLISSLQSKKTASFKKRFRSCDALLIDDIQFISGKEFTQEEFFHTFNELYMSERQIILNSDRPPEEIPKIEERLSSRFMGGLTVDIQPPDFEMRVAMLNQRLADANISAPGEAVEIIAEKVDSNVRELEGALRRVMALSDSRGEPISTELVREYFGEEKSRKSKRVRPVSIIAKTAKYYDYKSSDLTGKSRKAPLATARHVAMYIMKSELDTPYEQIGEMFGGRDHTTVMHGVDKITGKIQASKKLHEDVYRIKRSLFS